MLSSTSRHSQRGRAYSTATTVTREGTRVHAAGLLCLQLWAFVEARDVLPPLGQAARYVRLTLFGFLAARAMLVLICYPLGAILR